MSDLFQATTATSLSNSKQRAHAKLARTSRTPVKPQQHIPLPKAAKALKTKTIEERTLSPDELDKLIVSHNGTIENVAVTPSLAEYILGKYNTGNRKLRKNHANSVAKTISEGRWYNTGEPLIFAKEGILNNGQHRLQGIITANRGILIDIRFGISRDAFAMTDTGSKRLAGDVLGIYGSPSGFACAAALKLLLSYKQGLPTSYSGAMKTGNDEIAEYYNKLPEIDTVIGITKRVLKHKGFNTAPASAFAYLALMETDEATVTEFLELVDSGLATRKSEPTKLLFDRLIDDPGIIRGNRPAIIERFALFILAWQFWRDKVNPKVFRWKLGSDAFPRMKFELPE